MNVKKNELRMQTLEKLIHEKGFMRICELAEMFDVSEMTIRRDIYTLEKQGIAKNLKGIVFASENTSLQLFTKQYDIREESNMQPEEKSALGAFAASQICEGDSILFDVKDGDPERLKRNTGQNMEQLMHNLKLADSLGMNYSVRSIIIHGVNDTPRDVMLLKRIKAVLPGCRQWSLFSYHSLGQSKLEQLGRTKKDSFSAVDAEKLKMLEGILNG